MSPKPFGDKDADSSGGGAGGRTTGGSSILGKLIGGQQVPGGKSKVPAYVTNDLLERLRDTVVALQRNPDVEIPPVSLSAFVEAAIALAVEEAEEQHNGGRRFPSRPNAKLKTGPPVG
ncbi:hypothetical protein [Streptomyces acidiscabies]|uniref:Centromere-binding protein ParB C-terminal domain-containing protein n=1 Tax=Streptomyces acidiscabies TaxID=42234 RepID=A0AAP6BKK5_9ACTN|nr:hypothetical protein [Streptomyces acidiscabies]MBZ3918155.1 hypothetical protein [Streptomyces acidiscabies]MDX2966447.1 hypothetical protein [Streptomyces acidiscabies]MDX3796393.1 hypothetical protein [Streptomyces acidiscabies]